jgi:hypothetical protein
MSTEKVINSTIRTNLLNNEDFLYAHLVKFERPFTKATDGNYPTDASRYAYYTDGSYDISYDDGSGNGAQVYRANRVLSIGTYSETTQARASQMNLTLAGEDLKSSISLAGSISTSGVFTPTSTVYEGYPLDFVERGFKEGDEISFTYSSTTLTYRISSFTSNNTILNLAVIGTTPDIVSSFPGSTLSQTFTVKLESDELTAPLQERGITISGTSAASPNFINRSVMIYKVFIDQDTGLAWGGTGITIFKGVIQNVSIDESPTGVKVKWGITSHWGDWNQVGGRLTTDEIHRNLQPNQMPAPVQPIRNEYASDLGFLHAESSLSAIANYTTQETRTKMKKKRRGGLAGLFGGKYYIQEEYQIDIQNEVDLNIHLQGRYLPVIYGVQRVNGNPVFADTLNSDSKVIFTADAICEGEIHGLYNIYIDDIPLICTDDNDYDVRRVGGTDQDNTQLQCYGRMSHGETLMGKEGDPVETSGEPPIGVDTRDHNERSVLIAYGHALQTGGYIPGVTRDWFKGVGMSAGTNGVLHRKSWSIDGVHKIDSSFFSGRANQLASSMLYNPAQLTDGIESISVTNPGTGYTSNPTIAISAPSGGGVTATAEVQTRGYTEGGLQTTIGAIRLLTSGSGYTDSDTITVTITPNTQGTGARATANRGGYKRQVDYYEGIEPYWNSNHRLLDTAYSATRFEISPDATEIPEIEYVVKGSLLDCYNYDNIYVPDEVLNPASAGDITTRAATFKIGDVIAVEYSTDGSSWTNDTSGLHSNGKFKIIDKYEFQTNRQTTQWKFELDSAPALAVTNGAPGRTHLRLKNSSNQYWYMLTWNYTLCTDKTFPDEWKLPTWTLVGDKLTGTFSTADAALLGSTSDYTSYQFYTTNWTDIPSLSKALLTGTWAGNVVTIDVPMPLADATASLAAMNARLKIKNGKTFKVPSGGTGTTNYDEITGITNSKELFNTYSDTDMKSSNARTYVGRGALLQNTTTGEEREIEDFNTTSDTITLSTPFYTPPTPADKFTITGRGADKRSSTNPAIQTLDYLSNTRYGKGLTGTDLNIDSFIASAKLCDTRSNVTLKLKTVSGIAAGDVFELKVGGSTNSGDLVAQGTVGTASGDIDAVNTTITLTNVLGKFTKAYSTYGQYLEGDIIYTVAGRYYRAGSTVTNTSAVEPVHETGTVGGMTYICKHTDTSTATDIILHKTAGNGTASTIALEKRFGKPVEYGLYDSDWVRYWRYYGWDRNNQAEVTRHQTNFILDTGKSQFANINALLSHFNGILSYENGKYVLDVETQEDAPTINLNSSQENINPYYIENSDIIGKISLKDDSQKKGKNTIKSSVADPQNNWGSRSITFFNSDFLKADRDIVKTGNFPFTGITNYWNGRIGVEKELFQSRFSKEISFTIGPKGLLLKVGQVISMNYDSFGWSNKLFRIENLNFNANCNVSVKATEYDDSIYEITKQQALGVETQSSAHFSLPVVESPSSLATTTNKAGSVIITWTNGTDFVEGTDSTQIWASSTNDRSASTLIATIDNAESYAYTTAVADTKYYWVRHRRKSKKGLKSFITSSGFFPVSTTGGTTGTALAISAGAATISLVPSSHVIDWNKTSSAETSTIAFSTTTFNMEGTIYYEFLVGANTRQNLTTSTYTLGDYDDATCDTTNTSTNVTVDSTTNYKVGMKVTGAGIPASTLIAAVPSATNFTLSNAATATATNITLNITDEPGADDAPIQVTVKARQGSAGASTILAQDVTSIFAVQDGQSTVTGILTNEAHTIPAATDATVSSFSGSGGTFLVYYGNTEIADITDYQASDLVFSVQATTGTVTAAINATSGVYSISALGSDTATVTFRATIKGSMLGGLDTTNDVTRDKVYTISKAKVGATGTGVAGLNQKTISLYYLNNTTSTAPTRPDNDLFWNFAEKKLVQSTGTTTTLSDGHASLDSWTQALPSTTSTNGVRWVTMAVASANTAEDTISSGDWAAPAVVGADGSQYARIDLYQRNASATAPAKPTTNLFYNFSLGALVADITSTTPLTNSSSDLNSWKLDIPLASAGGYLHTTSAVALANTSASHDTIAPANWADVTILTTQGTAGTASISNIVTANNPWIFKSYEYDPDTRTDTVVYSPTTITLTANTQNTTNATGAWTASNSVPFASVDHTIDSNGIASCTIAASAVVDGMTVTYTLHSDDNSLADHVTIKLFEGDESNDVAVLENEVHLLLANDDGTIKSGGYSGSGTEIRLSEGGKELDYLHTASATGDLSAGEWYITSITATTGITVGAKSSEAGATSSASRHAQIADHSSAATGTDLFTITYNITLKSKSGTVNTVTGKQRIGKSKQGTTGTTGASTNIVFKRAASVSTPSNSSGVPTGWSDGPPSGTDLLWASQGTKALNSADFVWTTPFKIEAGAVAEIYIYRKNNSGAPSGGSYNFTNNTLALPTNWVKDPPALTANNDEVYVALGLSTGAPTATAASVSWGTPVLYARRTDGTDGSPGAAGLNSSTVSLYNKNTSSSSAPSAFSGTFTYTFATGAISNGTLNGWTTAVPALAAGEYAWVRQATASSSATTDTIPTSEFSTAVMHSGVGEDGQSITGAAGNSNALVALYAVNTSSSSAPSAFSGTFTYTYATGAVSGGTLNGWQTTVPTVAQGSFLWVRQATASSNTTTDTIATSEFSAAVVASASGANGAPGADGDDGAGIEYIFAVTADSSTSPSAPNNSWGFDQPSSPWADAAPAVTTSNKALWSTQRAIVGSPSAGDAVSASWTSATVVGRFADDGSPGAAGANSATVTLYRKSSSNSSAPTAFSGTFTYTFATGAVTGGTLNGWTTALPSITNGEYIWQRQATASSTATTDSIPTSEFSGAVVHSGVGANGESITGAAGNSNALVALYAVNTSNSSAPSAFSGTFTYTFATGAVTGGTLNGWTANSPNIPDGSYLWARQATASSNTTTDTIATSEFSAAVVIGGVGEDGDTGPSGTANLVGKMEAVPSTVIWSSTDAVNWSPTGTTQDQTITFYNGLKNETCVIRWTLSIIAWSTADFITSVAEITDSTSSFSLGSISPSSATNRKYATVVVTHDDGLTLTADCLLSVTGIAGAGK